jgi:hypothetical protein
MVRAIAIDKLAESSPSQSAPVVSLIQRETDSPLLAASFLRRTIEEFSARGSAGRLFFFQKRMKFFKSESNNAK